MKKIITTLAFVALSTVSAKAIDLPDLGMFSVTAGLAANARGAADKVAVGAKSAFAQAKQLGSRPLQ